VFAHAHAAVVALHPSRKLLPVTLTGTGLRLARFALDDNNSASGRFAGGQSQKV